MKINDSWPIPVLHDDPCLHPLRDEAMKVFEDEGGSFATVLEVEGKRVQISVRELDKATEFVDEAKVRDPRGGDVQLQIDKLRFSIKESRKELVEKVGGLQILDTCFGYLEWQCEKVATAVDSTNHSRD